MPDGRLYRCLRHLADIRPAEARTAFHLFLYFFLITFSVYVIKPVKENLLIGVTPAWWPYADLVTAGLIGFVVALNARLLQKLSRRRYFCGSAIFFAVNLLIFWLVFDLKERTGTSALLGGFHMFAPIRDYWPLPVFVFSFWSDIFISMSVTHFWFAVNDVFNPHQTKRMVGFFVTGGLLGGIAGSLLTSRLAHVLGPVNILLGCPVLLVLTLVVVDLIYDEQQKMGAASDCGQTQTISRTGHMESIGTILGDVYLRMLAGILASAIIVGSLINYQFKISIKAAIPTDIDRVSFFGSFFLGILVFSTVFHIFTTEQVLKNFGIRMCLFVAPSTVLLGSLSVFLFPAAGLVVWACAIRGSDKMLDTTISQSVRELLYIPVPAAIKYEAKMFIDMFVNKFAVGLAALLFWLLYRVSSFAHKTPVAQVRELGVFAIGFALVCLFLVWRIYSGYLAAVKNNLARRWQDAHKVVEEHLDIDATHLIVDTLQSREKSSTLYAMNLFQLIQKKQLSPELMALLSFKEEELKARSMDSLLDVGGEVFYREIDETIADKDIETMVPEIMAMDSYKSVMKKRFSDLISNENAGEVERMEAARLISLMEGTPEVLKWLAHLLQDRSSDVLNYALRSAAVHLRKEHVPLIINLLANPSTMRAAQDALAAYGSGIEKLLGQHLQNAHERLEIRSAIPDILARFANQKAADILTEELAHIGEDMEPYLIDALYRIRSNQAQVHFKQKKILSAVLSLIKISYAIYLEGLEHQPSRDQSASAPDWKAVLDLKIKRIFDLLTLVYPPEDIVKAYQNIHQGTKRSVDFSLELLDNILNRDLKNFLFPIIEELTPEEKTRRVTQVAKSLEQRLRVTKPKSTARFL